MSKDFLTTLSKILLCLFHISSSSDPGGTFEANVFGGPVWEGLQLEDPSEIESLFLS